MSGVMNPFETLFGVVISRVSSRRALMLPSLLATYARAYSRRPASTISARSCSSNRVLMGSRQPAAGSGQHVNICSLPAACCRPPAEFRSAFLGAEVVRRAAGAQRERRAQGATCVPQTGSRTSRTDGARVRDGGCAACLPPPRSRVHHPPEQAGDDDQEDGEQDPAEPRASFREAPCRLAGWCAAATPSSARLAA